MDNAERETCVMAIKRLDKILTDVQMVHYECEKLVNLYGWDIETFEIAKAGMALGLIVSGLATTLGYEDGWLKEEDAK